MFLPVARATAIIFLFIYTKQIKAINQLSFSGGGAFGAVEIGILKKIIEDEPDKVFDFYTGISAGGINAGYLSFYFHLEKGMKNIQTLYESLTNDKIYKILPTTGTSLFNTYPLLETLTSTINNMPNEPIIHTLIGATNLKTGNLDIYNFKEVTQEEKPILLMATSAIPVLFPPINFRDSYYADGGVLSNELLNIKKFKNYLNITYISPCSLGQQLESNFTIPNSIKDILERTFQIIKNNFDNPLATLNQKCRHPIGEINMYFVNSNYLKDYNMLNFNHNKELLHIGYKFMETKKYNIC